MPGKKRVDHNGISADVEEEAETLTVQDSDLLCLDRGVAETTPRTVVYTPPEQVSSRTAGHDGDDPSTPTSSPEASRRSSREGNKGLATYGRRVMKGFRRFVDVNSSPGRAKEEPSVDAAGDVLTPRSAGRTLTGRKDRSRCVNRDGCLFHRVPYLTILKTLLAVQEGEINKG